MRAPPTAPAACRPLHPSALNSFRATFRHAPSRKDRPLYLCCPRWACAASNYGALALILTLTLTLTLNPNPNPNPSPTPIPNP